MFKCKECGEEVTTRGNALSQHVKFAHGMNSREYAMKHYEVVGEESNSYSVSHDKELIKFKKNKDYKCPICDLDLTMNSSYIESHIKRAHGILDYEEFYLKFYTIEGGIKLDEIDRDCGLCSDGKVKFKDTFDVNHERMTFRPKDRIVYACQSDDCRNETSLRILGEPYDIETYEHIGARVEYLTSVHKKSEEFIKKNLKVGEIDKSKPYSCSLDHYRRRYGHDEGTRLYKDRNRRIGLANTLEHFIVKYGEEVGRKKFEEKKERLKKSTLGTTKSKIQSIFRSDVLDHIDTDYIEEYPFDYFDLRIRSDFYYEKFDTHIEFFGDYWHANKNMFSSGDIHKTLKIPVDEIWLKDEKRIERLTSTGSNVIIVWESTYHEYSKSGNIESLIEIIRGILNAGHKSKYFRI